MRAIRTANSNLTYTGPTPEVADLPCQRGDGAIWAIYDLSDEERMMIANGAKIRLGIWTEPIPPVSMSVINEPEVQDPDDLRCEGCGNLYVRDVISPALLTAGFELRGDWYTGDGDSFGPLTRCIETDQGIVVYG